MPGTTNLPQVYDLNGWMRDIEKRIQRQERRAPNAAHATVSGEGEVVLVRDLTTEPDPIIVPPPVVDVPETIAPVRLPSNITGQGIIYGMTSDWVWVWIDGAMSTATGVTTNLNTALLPVNLRPAGNVRGSGYFGGFPGHISALASGAITGIHQSGATRASVSGLIKWPLIVMP